MDLLSKYHSYEFLFDEKGLNRKVVFEAADRSALFSDHNRIAGNFEIIEDGQRIGRATYDAFGRFWTLFP